MHYRAIAFTVLIESPHRRDSRRHETPVGRISRYQHLYAKFVFSNDEEKKKTEPSILASLPTGELKIMKTDREKKREKEKEKEEKAEI